MHRLFTLLAGCSVLLFSAQVDRQEDEMKCCCTSVETNLCLVKVQKAVDGRLNATYDSSLQRLKGSPADIANLREAERAWIGYRDATCKAESDLYKGGSMAPQVYGFCVIKLIKTRTADLKRIYLSNR